MKMLSKMILPVLILGLGTATACGSENKADGNQEESTKQEASKAEASKKEAPKAEAKPEADAFGFDAPPPVGAKARCPVMGGEFTVTEDSERSEHKGRHYVFCCPGCKPSFDEDPQKYLKAK
jgi:YHS domain-containing protein